MYSVAACGEFTNFFADNLHHAGIAIQCACSALIQRNFVTLIETGQNQPTITTISKLARALGVKPSKMLVTVEKLTGHGL